MQFHGTRASNKCFHQMMDDRIKFPLGSSLSLKENRLPVMFFFLIWGYGIAFDVSGLALPFF